MTTAPLTWNQATSLRWNGTGPDGAPLTWNGQVVVPKYMATKVVLNLQSLTEDELIQEARTLADAIVENAGELPTPDPTPEQLDAAADAAEAGKSSTARKQAEATASTLVKEELFDTLRGALTASAAWGENKVKDPAKLTKLFTLKKPRTTVTAVPQVGGVAVTLGDNPGELDMVWEPEPTGKSYEVQFRYVVNGNGDAPWTHFKTVTSSKLTLTGLNRMQTIQLRVRAIGPRGLVGPWSDPAEHGVL